MTGTQKAFRFDVAFSFAGAHRDKVRAIAELVAAKIGKKRVFFDEWYRAEILGGNMRVLLQRFYGEKSLMVVADLSKDYADRPWCQGESEAIDALRMRIDSARDETARLRVFIVRFGPGEVPGMLENTGWLDGVILSAEEIAGVILERLDLLNERMAESTASALAQPVPSSPSLPASASSPPILFFHPATNDALYSRRERELDWLDACAKEPRIRIATVTGVGGLGKTSLVGHWIEVCQGWQHRAFRGVFFYSFFSDPEPKHFFPAFINFAYRILRENRPQNDDVLHHDAATLAERWPFLLVLDGLEVLQFDAEDSTYGWINDGELNEFVSRLGEKGPSLLVLTSRFPFPEVTRQFPEHARRFELDMFCSEEGADLLEKCGLPEDREARMAFSDQFGGHPLALRLFAGASMIAPATPPSDLSRELMRAEKLSTLPDPDEPGIADNERQSRRQRRQFQKLLEWLQAKLPAPKRRLLQLVALFREPVPTVTLVTLATGLDVMKADFLGCDPARIRSLLDALVREHLLQRDDVPDSDTARWSAHPIVREIFRTNALKSGDTVATQFAEIVAGRSGGSRPKNLAELQPILEAIEVLLDAGDFKAANELFYSRLENGRIFKRIPAPQQGLRCAQRFVESSERVTAVKRVLGPSRLADFLREVAFWGTVTGEMGAVERRYEESAAICYELQYWAKASVRLRCIADSRVLRGALRPAVESASAALDYAFRDESEKQRCRAQAQRGHAQSLLGNLREASADFAAADALERKMDRKRPPLHESRGIQWCSHLFLLGDCDAARRLTLENRILCEAKGANDEIARCNILLGRLDLTANDLEPAANQIQLAVRVFREARQGLDLPDALLAQARLSGRVDDCEEALRLAARSGFVLKQCDALNLRARLRCEAGEPAKATEDAREALEIAERCGYYWGRHEALRQLRDAAKASGSWADEKLWDDADQELSARMQPLVEEALEIEHAHGREMEKLYGKK